MKPEFGHLGVLDTPHEMFRSRIACDDTCRRPVRAYKARAGDDEPFDLERTYVYIAGCDSGRTRIEFREVIVARASGREGECLMDNRKYWVDNVPNNLFHEQTLELGHVDRGMTFMYEGRTIIWGDFAQHKLF